MRARGKVLLFAVTCAAAAACVDFSGLGSSDGPVDDAGRVGDAATSDGVAIVSDTGTPRDDGAAPVDARTDAGAPWLLYAYNEQQVPPVWTTPTTLDTFFGGSPNAPPPNGISAMVFAAAIDRLFVFAEDGTLYVRAAGAWQPPRPASSVFTTLGTTVPKYGFHVPQSDGGKELVSITLARNPTGFEYTYRANDVVTPDGTPIALKDEFGGPPQATGTCPWSFEVVRTALYPSPTWLRIFQSYGDVIWQLDGNVAWTRIDAGAFKYFAPDAGGSPPPLTKIQAAFYDPNASVLYMVATP